MTDSGFKAETRHISVGEVVSAGINTDTLHMFVLLNSPE